MLWTKASFDASSKSETWTIGVPALYPAMTVDYKGAAVVQILDLLYPL
jgi:hypothetical protein